MNITQLIRTRLTKKTMNNNTFEEIAEKFNSAKNIVLLPHVGIDGDAVGSCVALASVLRAKGKNVHVLYKEEIPSNLAFIANGYFTDNSDVIPDDELDIAACIDCGGYDRFKGFEEKFDSAKLRICIDHHGTSMGIANLNYIDPDAAACGVLIYDLLKVLGVPEENKVEVGTALFVAITTDTGNFQYSNTNRKCHEIMAELYDWDIDFNRASVEVYENERPEKLMIASRASSRIQMVAGGKGAVSYVTYDDLEEIGVKAGETDPIVQSLRSINGVEIAAFLKEKNPGEVRVSYRSKLYANVAELAMMHDGGGHEKAAGCTLHMDLKNAVEVIKKDIEEALK